MKKPIPTFATDEEAEAFLDGADLSEYDLRGMVPVRFKLGAGEAARREVGVYKFEIYRDKAGEYRFQFKASNGQTMFSSEGYKAKASALTAIESIRKSMQYAAVDDRT